MLGTPLLPYDTVAIDNHEYIVRYSPDASDAYRAANRRPLAHLQVLLVVINPDRPGTIPLAADHYYDPPPFASAQDAAKAIAIFLEDRGSDHNPSGFPALRHPSGDIYKLPDPIVPPPDYD